MKIITFLSDFGAIDWFVAAVKGEILKVTPRARIVDITHNIKPYDVRGAAFVLSSVFRNFPKGSIHLSVVDPGVGSERKPLIVQSHGHLFVGPDNGLFSRIYEKASKVYEIKMNARMSSTFHARDIFGPTAARLAGGTSTQMLGKRCKDYVCHETAQPRKKKNIFCGEIVYIDHFGNCVTNIPNSEEITKLRVLGRTVAIRNHYSAGSYKGLVGVKGSLGYYEIASYVGSACQVLKAGIGVPIEGYAEP
ncbi:MAG: SAM-dependent chlorinase/fluorinase [candidate division WOR-3 bacterium]|nr:SAM-dependent chlorinase/fluorinase [candidate division WOR-3 bacterium]